MDSNLHESENFHPSGRRHSIDTVSTYLSQDEDSFMDYQSVGGREGPQIGNLVNIESEDLDDDTFDDEVIKTMARNPSNNLEVFSGAHHHLHVINLND